MNKYFVMLLVFAGIGPIISCGSNKNDAEDAGTTMATADNEGGKGHESPNTATLTEAQIQSIGIEWGPVDPKQLTASLKANGVLKVPNQNKASVNSVYSGVIKSISVQPGSHVVKGQTIATIANPDFIEAQSEYLNTNARISLAELEVKRQKELNAGNAGALKNLQAAETELRTLLTARSTYAQQIQLMGINPSRLSNGKLISVLNITSPITGVISNVLVKIGSYVDVTTIMAEIVDNSQLHLDLYVYEKDLARLKDKQTIHFTATNNPGKEYDAEIFSLGSSFEGESKAISVHAKVKGNKTDLIDGMNITAIISLDQTTVPAVPNDAIVTVDSKDYIFLLVEGGSDNELSSKESLPLRKEENPEQGKIRTFERIPVARGTSDIGFTEIILLKELPKGAMVVTKGAFFVSAKMTNFEEE